MRKIREILRLRYAAGLSIRQIKASTKLSVGTIQKLLRKADALELGWPRCHRSLLITSWHACSIPAPTPASPAVSRCRLVTRPPGAQAQGDDQTIAVGRLHGCRR